MANLIAVINLHGRRDDPDFDLRILELING